MNDSDRVPPMPAEEPNVGRAPQTNNQQTNNQQYYGPGQPTINPAVVGSQQSGPGPQQPGPGRQGPQQRPGPQGAYAGPYPGPPQKKPRRRKVGMAVAGSIVAAAVVGFGAGYFVQPTHVSVQIGAQQAPGQSGQGTQGQSGQSGQSGQNGFGGGSSFGGGNVLPGEGQTGPQEGGQQGGQQGTGQQGRTNGTMSASTAQAKGIVDITTALKYEGAEAAGTGMILTSNGEILTNNHVVEGSTSIKVKVASTGKKYTARVVGTDKKDDVALLKLTNASGLTTVQPDSSAVSAGTKIIGIGNAGGTGKLTAAPGKVTALNQQIRTMSEGAASSESLSGLIETSANVQAGDSGGPLEETNGKVVGMDTAASTNGSTGNSSSGYAIPINTALQIADTIASGHETNTVSIGYPAFLGIELGTASGRTSGGANGRSDGQTTLPSGAIVAGVIPGTPAASAGLQSGDVITKVGSHSVGSAKKLSSTLDGYKPGQTVTIHWTDVAGAAHQQSVTLVDGPVE